MKYCECKQALYNSKAMESIPDKWKEEVPIVFDDSGKRNIGFMYSLAQDGKVKLKKMISVSIESAEVNEYSIEQLQEYYQVSDQYLKAISINDYDMYFSQKDEYETLLSGIVDSGFNEICLSDKDAKRFLQLTKELFSTKQYEEIVYRIGKGFYEFLDKCEEQ